MNATIQTQADVAVQVGNTFSEMVSNSCQISRGKKKSVKLPLIYILLIILENLVFIKIWQKYFEFST